MQKFLGDMPLFVEVAKRKSFTLAAVALDIGVSTLSRRISLLEKHMGVSLFVRNTRSVELTASGRSLLDRCEYILAEAADAYESTVSNQNEPAGLIRISLFGDIYHFHLAEVLTRFAASWPRIQLHVLLNERPVDLFAEPFDLDIRFGPLPDSSMKVRKIYTFSPGLYASPQLLKRHPAPETPYDLLKLPCISLQGLGNTWTLFSGEDKVELTVVPKYIVNSIKIWRDFALAGLGLGVFGPADAEPYEKDGSLVRLLPQWHGAPIGLHILLPDGQLPRRVRLLVDYLADYCASLSR